MVWKYYPHSIIMSFETSEKEKYSYRFPLSKLLDMVFWAHSQDNLYTSTYWNMYWSVVYICKDYIIQENMYYCHQLFFIKLTYSSNRKSQDWFWKHWCSKAKIMLFFSESHCKCWSNATKSLFSTEDLKPTLLSYPVGAATAAAAACRSQLCWSVTGIQKLWHMPKCFDKEII